MAGWNSISFWKKRMVPFHGKPEHRSLWPHEAHPELWPPRRMAATSWLFFRGGLHHPGRLTWYTYSHHPWIEREMIVFQTSMRNYGTPCWPWKFSPNYRGKNDYKNCDWLSEGWMKYIQMANVSTPDVEYLECDLPWFCWHLLPYTTNIFKKKCFSQDQKQWGSLHPMPGVCRLFLSLTFRGLFKPRRHAAVAVGLTCFRCMESNHLGWKIST